MSMLSCSVTCSFTVGCPYLKILTVHFFGYLSLVFHVCFFSSLISRNVSLLTPEMAQVNISAALYVSNMSIVYISRT